MTRIGPRMKAVAWYVNHNPGCVVFAAAMHVAPRGSWMYGYRTVKRAISAGLVRAVPNPKQRGSRILFPV